MLKPELLPGISQAQGYKGSYLLRRDMGHETEFITIMLFDSLASIQDLAGPQYENAVIPEERRKYLLRYDARSLHYNIAATHSAAEANERTTPVGAALSPELKNLLRS
jgi:hypothetical protein